MTHFHYPEVVQKELERITHTGGEKIVSDEGSTYIILGLGERRTGGYAIEVVDITEQAGPVNSFILVKAKEIKPAPDAFVTQAFTYPTLVYRIPYTTLPIRIEWVRFK
ncbi:protease complex subunit PrcB family protein [Bacillus horti]|uniref:PrcB C-terminal domain-containing protein n=1 Tax=Caldalkalibacillus horti TaxID=77523 RepID=A0ABT9W3M9_9BACI|nr:protease complex subunit PrcB family protein [Bacillus horti]MDQ0167861.1 hypothetical protein [Bacillus horti]